MNAPRPGEHGGRTFRQKLGVYLFGVAIGLLLLGWFQMGKQLAVQAQQARAQQGESPSGPDGPPPAQP